MEIEVPEHLIVLGGSYFGLEFAQIYRRFGSKVTVIEAAPRLVAREDEDVSATIKDILEREQIAIALETKCTSFEKTGAASASLSTRLQVQPRSPVPTFFSPSAVALIPTSLVLKRPALTLTATALSSPTKC
jgi:pyruvate/2-oxoglutarate dehydrogenase complex dihydrolipoamide dehydrogenase (E3) component